MQPHILIVEDEEIIRTSLRRLLTRHKFQVSEAGSVTEAKENYTISDFDLIISDLRLPGPPGTDIIDLAKGTPVLIMTSYASLRSAVSSIKQGASDYIAKPFDHEELLKIINNTIQQHHYTTDEATKQKVTNSQPYQTEIIGRSPIMLKLFDTMNKVAPTQSTVLILGESGTGKELVAKALHERSTRAHAPLISVNCAAIPESLIESELFGHEKGSFTGAISSRTGLIEAAHGGTLFLDEIGELPLEAQARLLRVLQEGEIRKVGSVTSQKVDIRLMAATHRDLKSLSARGEFRTDLFYRLNVINLHLPALRERGQDILEIAESFLDNQAKLMGKNKLTFSKTAQQAILNYSWPGNVRELKNIVERTVILCEGSTITAKDLGLDMERQPHSSGHNDMNQFILSPSQYQDTNNDFSLEDYFQHFVLENQNRMTETELAKRLGISRKCLWERRQKLGIPRKKIH